jgi:molybdopterin synthase sulfur carrier subunit
MRIKVKLFASLRRYADVKPGTPFELELPEGACLQDLVDTLNIPPQEAKVIFVNGISHPMDWTLNPDDEVGIFPPIAGG